MPSAPPRFGERRMQIGVENDKDSSRTTSRLLLVTARVPALASVICFSSNCGHHRIKNPGDRGHFIVSFENGGWVDIARDLL